MVMESVTTMLHVRVLNRHAINTFCSTGTYDSYYEGYEGCFDDNLDKSGNDRIWPLTGSDPQGKEMNFWSTNTLDR